MNSTTQTIVIVAIVIALLVFRVIRQTRERRWSIRGMWAIAWVFVAIAAVIVALDTLQTPFAPLAAVAGLAAGIGVGFYQGSHTTLRPDKPNGSVFVRTTPIGSAIFLIVLALRIGLRLFVLGGMSPQAVQSGQVPQLPVGAMLLSSALLALAAGSVLGLRWYIQRAYDAAPAG